MRDLDRDDWATLLAQLDDPPVGTVAEALADARDLDVLDAYDVVEEALAEDVLAETDTGGAFEAVRLAEEAVREEDHERYLAGEDDPRPLDAYEYSGYMRAVREDESVTDEHIRALDASVQFTASSYAPPFTTPHEDGGDWWKPGYNSACRATEFAIVDAILAGRDDAEDDDETAETPEPAEPADMEGREADSGDDDPQGEGAETAAAAWGELDFSETTPQTWAPAQIDRDAWMCREETKAPYAPWADADAPVECNHEDHTEATTCAECSHHAGYKWGSDGSREHVYADHDTAREWADMVPTLSSDLVYIQREADPFAFVDGDDVRAPETGEIHPAFEAILEHLGVTYADVSTSGGGVHAVYRGEIPLDGVPQATFPIDSEPWGENDDPPAVEIYDGKHVCIATGDHIAGSGTEVAEWDDDALADVLRANGYEEREEVGADTELDLDDYEPTATGSDETTDDIRDIFRALDRLDPKRVAERTIVREWTRGKRSFLPVWGSSDDNGTANYINDKIWHDTGRDGGYGGPAVMAAIDAGLINHTGAEPSDVRGSTFFEAIDHLRDLGFSIPELEDTTSDDADPVAALPLERLDRLDVDEARRYASKHGVSWPTTRDARERLRSDIMETLRHGDTRLHDAPTALGKSYTVATEPWLRRTETTGDAPVIHLSETREARDQAADASADANVSYARLLGRSEACPVAAGDHDPAEDDDEDDPDVVVTKDGTPASAWFDRVCEGRGLPFSVAHKYLDEHNDQDVELPCCTEGECRSIAQWDGLPRDDDGEPAVDVIHATHGFAHVPSLRSGTNLIFDERPGFKTDLGHERVREAVAAYLSAAKAPVSTYEQMVSRALDGADETPNEHGEHAYLSDALDYEPDREWYLEADGAHTLAPALTRAIYYALSDRDGEDAADANGRYAATVPHEPPRLDGDANDSDGWNRTYVSVVLDEDLTVRHVRDTPSMSGARSVVGLDAHPDVYLWQQNVHPDILVEPVLDPSERALWRRYERGLLTVGVGDATRPLTSGEYFDEDGSRAFFGALRDHYGERFSTTITAASVESRTADLLEDVGVDEPETMHYGEEKSRGDFGDEDVGALNGCIDPGDDYVLDLLAEAGLDARPETVEDDDGDTRRAHGRGFVGPDADAAASLLASVREQHVAQAAGRYARNADDPDDRAIVFVRTDAAPPGFLDLEVPGVEWLPTDTQREIVDELRERSHATAREIADVVDVSKEHVRQTLDRLRDDGRVSVREGAGEHGAHLYRALAGLGSGETVTLSRQTTNDPVCSPYTWSLAIDTPETARGLTVAVTTDDDPASTAAAAGSDDGEPPS